MRQLIAVMPNAVDVQTEALVVVVVDVCEEDGRRRA